MTTITLTPKTLHGKNRLIETAKALPASWDFTWDMEEERSTIQARDGQGPWLLLIPAGVPMEIGRDFSRWVHKTNDLDLAVNVH